MWAVKLEHLLNVGVCSKIRVTWEYRLWIGIKFLLDPCLCQPMWECDLPSSGLIEPRPAGTSGTTSVQAHHPVLWPRSSSLGKEASWGRVFSHAAYLSGQWAQTGKQTMLLHTD